MRVHTKQQVSWRESGVPGIRRATLWNDGLDVAAEFCQMAAGAVYPEHEHRAWEQMLVLAGSIDVDGEVLNPGDYAFTAPGETHCVTALSDARVFLSFGQSLSG